MSDFKTLPQAHLIDILRTTKSHHPNFTLLLGAGASVTSGVKTSREMIKDWREQFYKQYNVDLTCDQDKFLSTQDWYKKDDEYSILFEKLFDQPSQRREYIECCLEKSSPSWGYTYLVNLLSNSIFNTVFTTNFDDLLNEACYLFSNSVRPIVLAHDSSIRNLRITSKRTKIIKLHGDYLYDNIKNTISELETLESNTREKFRQLAREFGLIVVGYSGNDRSVIDALDMMMRSEVNFPHGVYWCLRKGSVVNNKLQALQRYDKFKLVTIEGFDELFADLHEGMQLSLQQEMSDPYAALAVKLNKLSAAENFAKPEKPHPVIERDLRLLGEKLASLSQPKAINPRESKSIKLDAGDVSLEIPVPFGFLARVEERDGKYQDAFFFLFRDLEHYPTLDAIVFGASLLQKYNEEAERNKFVAYIKKNRALFRENYMAVHDVAIRLITAKCYDEASEVLDAVHEEYVKLSGNQPLFIPFYILNKMQIKKHQDRSYKYSDAEIQMITKLTKHEDIVVQMGAYILLGNKGKANECLRVATALKKLKAVEVEKWPIYQLLIEPQNDKSNASLPPIH